MYLKDFVNVGRVCLDCKSNIISTANNEQKSWGFSRLVWKTKKKKKKSEKSVSEEGTVWSLDKNPLTSKVKVRFEPGSSSDGSAATKARSRARSSTVDSGDEIRRP